MAQIKNPRSLARHRILVAGTSGAGKTTVARRVATVLNIAHIEIDALFHGPGLDNPRFVLS